MLDIRRLYDRFNAPVTALDCGTKCAPHNPPSTGGFPPSTPQVPGASPQVPGASGSLPSGKPFCCDICHAVPVAYHQEWTYAQKNTDLWHVWRGDECVSEPCDPAEIQAQTPPHLTLLACKGPALCQRPYRATSCRQFPFFPYVSSNYRFIGLAYDWDFEDKCWVISNLAEVTAAYRGEFIATYDEIFAFWQEEFDSYADLSEDMREAFATKKRRIPLLHRNGGYYLVSPSNERMYRTTPDHFKRFGPYRSG